MASCEVPLAKRTDGSHVAADVLAELRGLVGEGAISGDVTVKEVNKSINRIRGARCAPERGHPGGRGGSPPVTLPQPLQVTLAMMKPHRSSFLMVVPRGTPGVDSAS
ncbi:hypothetical protein RI054_23g100640 [Pseudoscourfieldia marina]